LAKSLGKGLRELRKATDDIKGQFESEIARIDLDEAPKAIAPCRPGRAEGRRRGQAARTAGQSGR